MGRDRDRKRFKEADTNEGGSVYGERAWRREERRVKATEEQGRDEGTKGPFEGAESVDSASFSISSSTSSPVSFLLEASVTVGVSCVALMGCSKTLKYEAMVVFCFLEA
jgi:hypothetical protein